MTDRIQNAFVVGAPRAGDSPSSSEIPPAATVVLHDLTRVSINCDDPMGRQNIGPVGIGETVEGVFETPILSLTGCALAKFLDFGADCFGPIADGGPPEVEAVILGLLRAEHFEIDQPGFSPLPLVACVIAHTLIELGAHGNARSMQGLGNEGCAGFVHAEHDVNQGELLPWRSADFT